MVVGIALTLSFSDDEMHPAANNIENTTRNPKNDFMFTIRYRFNSDYNIFVSNAMFS